MRMIREAINAVLVSPDLCPEDFHPRYGVELERMKEILHSWPNLDEHDQDTRLTIGGCLNEVCYGIIFDDDPDVVGLPPADWSKWFSASRDEMRDFFKQWRELLSRKGEKGTRLE